MSILDRNASQLLHQLQSGSLLAVETVQAFLDEIKRLDGRTNAFVLVEEESALLAAKDIDRRRAAGEPLGELAGLPVAVKDILCTRGTPTTCGSRMLKDFHPPYDATAIERLRAADAIIVGRLNMDEFAMGSSTENSALGITRNPWNLECVPGGSSGGSAVCVAARMVPVALGTDTGGSIRQPAAYCGIVGLKPTYGRVSRYGLVAFASSLDQIGPMAHSVEDAALLLQTISGHDPRDSTSADAPVASYTQTLGQSLSGLRVGVAREHFGEGLSEENAAAVRDALKVYESLGAKIVDVSLPHAKYGVAAYYVIAPSEASSNLARFDGAHYGHRCEAAEYQENLAQEKAELIKAGDEKAAATLDSPLVRMYRQSRSEGFGAEVKRRIMLGTYALSAGYYDAYYLKALKVRRLIQQDFEEAFKKVDVIAGPTTPDAAFKIGERVDDPLAMYLADIYTVSANLAGIPSMSIPCGFTSTGLPLGLQLQAPAFEEGRLLCVGHAYQQETDWHKRRPSI